jgi:hypothetical protein
MSFLRYDTPTQWREFVSRRGIEIRVSFMHDKDNDTAEQVSIFVEGPHALLRLKTEVNAVLIALGESSEIVWKKPLALLFRTELDTVFCGTIYGGIAMNQRMQVAAKLDDIWEIDPIQPGEAHNFNFAFT